MAKFSDRYGYTQPSEILVRETITEPINNSILNWLHRLKERYNKLYYHLKKSAWCNFFNRDIAIFNIHNSSEINVFRSFVKDRETIWYEKLNSVEYIIFMLSLSDNDADIIWLNNEFERHNFAYRIIKGQIVEITSENEIKAIEEAISHSIQGVRTHFSTALQHISAANKTPDCRASIKESISAVEVYCRDISSTSTLGDALKELKNKGVKIPSILLKAFELLYGYTNDKTTGIRHGLMDDENTLSSDEAIFMLISCSAFINYLIKKQNQ